MWSAPLWPTRLAQSARVTWHPGTRRSCGCRRPGRAARIVVAAARARPARAAVDPTLAAAPRHPVVPRRAPASAGAIARERRRAPRRRARRADAAPRVDAAPRSSPRTSTRCRCPATVRWSSRASPIGARRVVARAGARRNCALVELGGEDVRAERRRGAGRSACAHSVISSSTGPVELHDLVVVACGSRATRAAGGRRQRPSARGTTPQEPVMRRCEWSVRSPSKRRNRCLPWASTAVTARPASRSGQRSRRVARMRRLDRAGSRAPRAPRRCGSRRSGSCRPRAWPKGT